MGRGGGIWVYSTLYVVAPLIALVASLGSELGSYAPRISVPVWHKLRVELPIDRGEVQLEVVAVFPRAQSIV